MNEHATTATQVLAQSCHAFIGELWCAAFARGFHKPMRNGKTRLLWPFFDAEIPLPNEHTAPFWFYACEAATATIGSKDFRFVPPISTPLQIENIADAGIDSFIQPAMPPFLERVTVHIGTEVRQDMGRSISHLDNYTPVAHSYSGRIEIGTNFDYELNEASEGELDRAWRFRHKLAKHLGTPIKLPTCPRRLTNVAGRHLDHLHRYGLFVRGDFPGAEREWAGGNPVAIDDTHIMTELPRASMPVWFGFRITREGPPKALFNWCKAYVAHRDVAIDALVNPNSFAGYPDFTKRLEKFGVLQKQGKGGKGGKLDTRINALAAAMNGHTFNLDDV